MKKTMVQVTDLHKQLKCLMHTFSTQISSASQPKVDLKPVIQHQSKKISNSYMTSNFSMNLKTPTAELTNRESKYSQGVGHTC